MPVSTIKLASGHDMPLVGFGLWKVPADQAADTVYNVRCQLRGPDPKPILFTLPLRDQYEVFESGPRASSSNKT